MADATPFVRLMPRDNATQGMVDAIFGFSLPFLPDLQNAQWLTGVPQHERLNVALQMQIQMLQRLWDRPGCAYDLRFIGTNRQLGIGLSLLCRLTYAKQVGERQIQQQCQQHMQFTQQLYAHFGYELVPFTDEATLQYHMFPFRLQYLGEIRRSEALLTLENSYTEFEAYVPYPWTWTRQNRSRLLAMLLEREDDCLLSVCLEPTRLSPAEQAHLSHATSPSLRDLLWESGPHGRTTYTIYSEYATRLQQPFLLRLCLATPAMRTFTQLERQVRAELALEDVHTPYRGITTYKITAEPVLVTPATQAEWDAAYYSLHHLTWLPWGHNEGMALPHTRRLRALMDATEASGAFRIPIAQGDDAVGIPVRPLLPQAYTLAHTPAPNNTNQTSWGNNLSTPFSQSNQGPFSNPPAPHSQTSLQNPLAAYNQTSMSNQSTPHPHNQPPFSSTHASYGQTSAIHINRPEELLGNMLGSCQIEALLGKGGYGAVYRAQQFSLQRTVAVKIILGILEDCTPTQRHTLLARFAHEAQAVARLNHPNVLPIYEYQAGDIPYMVMPYVAGGSVADEIKANGKRPLPAARVFAVLQQVATALDYVHQQRLIHRDIKPHNLLCYPDGRIMLSDFGIVQFDDPESTRFTSSKEISPYTPAYASPEQLYGQPLDKRSDIYSLGIVVYELLTGHRPPPHAFSQSASQSIGREWGAFFVKALAEQPEKRFQSGQEMAYAFQTIASLQ